MSNKMILGAALAAVFLAGCQAQSLTSAPQQRPSSSRVAPAKATKPVQILIKFKAEMRTAEIQAFRAEFGTRNVGEIKGIGVLVEEVTNTRLSVKELLAEMNASPLVEYAELNSTVGIH